MKHVQQKHARGCGPAALAMVTGHSYDDVCAWFGQVDFDRTGLYVHAVYEYLAEHGFAVQVKHRYRQFFRSASGGSIERQPWPCVPFADRHVAQVLVSPCAPCDHFIAVESSGLVLDPMDEMPKRLADYHQVNQIAGVWPTPAPERSRP